MVVAFTGSADRRFESSIIPLSRNARKKIECARAHSGLLVGAATSGEEALELGLLEL